MKRTILFLAAGAILGTASAQTIVVQENFDAYTSGDMVAETAGAPWNTWSQAPGGVEDTPVSDEQAYSGTNSMKIEGVAGGGPVDLILELGNRTTGSYGLSWMMYVPAGFGGYFNIQHNEVPGTGSWMLDVTFAPDGSIEYLVDAVAAAGTYPQDEWFSVIMAIDMNAGTGSILINGTPQYSWQTAVPGPSQLGGIDFFAYAGGAPNVPTYYIDDVLFVELPGLGVDEGTFGEASTYPNPTSGSVWVELAGLSGSASASVLDITGRTVVSPRTPQQVGSASRVEFNLGALPEGVYFVRIVDGGRETVRRVTKH